MSNNPIEWKVRTESKIIDSIKTSVSDDVLTEISTKLAQLQSTFRDTPHTYFCTNIALKIEKASTDSQEMYLKIHADNSTHELKIKGLEANYR